MTVSDGERPMFQGGGRSSSGFRRPWAFWLGVVAVAGGVALHVPMYLSGRSDHYMLAGMPWDGWMIAGMCLMVVGYAGVLYGLAPRFSRPSRNAESQPEFEALDESRLRPAHLKLMAVLTLAVAVDTQKPFTFTFILPGVASEYDLRSASHPAPGHWPVALFPFVAILGTVVGSLLWGRLGDGIGRRASILLAATLFIGTAMCSAMPAFHWNLVACFVMGMSAGGLLPIAYSLLAETIPARSRGTAIVLVAGVGTALGFLLASWTAHWLIPTYSWRIMWFFGVPTGLALILLNRWIPESPRFLLANGHSEEAREVMDRFGIVSSGGSAPRSAEGAGSVRPGLASVFRQPYTALSSVLTMYGLAWGLVNFGFLVWLPVYVAKSGVSAGHVTTILAKAALFALPGAVGIAWLYGRWSSKGTLILASGLEAGALLLFAFYGNRVVHHDGLFAALLVVLLLAMWATVSAVAPYAAEVYPTVIRGAGSGVVAGATKLGGVIALGVAVMSWAPPDLTGAALLAAIPAGVASLLLLRFGIETRGRRLEEIAGAELPAAGPVEPRPLKRERTIRIRGVDYPVVLPSWRDPRLRLSATFVWLYILGQVEFHFRLSIPQIAAAILTCAVIEITVTFAQKRIFLWPASAMLTGNGIAFIMRIPGTEHGQWWSFKGVGIYAGVAALAMASKYFVKFRGRHIFNPSNVALVLTFLLLGSSRVEPLQFWWGPLSPALVIVLAVIVAGAFVVLSRIGLLAVAVLFWITFASSLGILALSGHAFSANWHLGPVADGYFWKVLITSPEVFIFQSFMITDPRTAPESRRGRRVYAVTIGLLGALLIAPMETEFAAKVALLSSLTIVCAARPLLTLTQEAIARRQASGTLRRLTFPRRRSVIGPLAATGVAVFAGLIVVAGSPARAVPVPVSATLASSIPVAITHTAGVVSLSPAKGRQIAADAVTDLRQVELALSRRDATRASAAVNGTYLDLLRLQIQKASGKPLVVPSYGVQSIALKLRPAVGQAPPIVVCTLSGHVTPLTYTAGATVARSGQTTAFTHQLELALQGNRFVIIGSNRAAASAAAAHGAGPANLSHGVGTFRRLHLVNVAPKLGLDFRQDAFRYNMYYDPQAMMGGGVCWLDDNNDGWLDLFAVQSYADVDRPEFKHGLPQSELFQNEHGHFVNITKSSGAGIRVKGTGCAAADLSGNGATDLVVTSATGVEILWNNGHGKFTPQVLPTPYAWYSGVGVADVNGDGRPDIFVAGYTQMDHPITDSIAGFPTNFQGVRDLLYLNEGPGKNGRDRFKEVGRQAGLEGAGQARHGLGVTFTDVNGDGRPDLYVADDEDPSYLYLNEPGGPLGFHFVDVAKTYGVANGAAGMGVAVGDYNDDGKPDIFVTNSRGQPHAAYQSKVLTNGKTAYLPEIQKFAKALDRKATVGWGDSWVDFANSGDPDLIIANGAIPVTNLKKDTEPVQVLQDLGGGRFANASGIVSPRGMPKIIGRGLAAADFDNDGRMAVAINSIGGPLVLLEDTGPVGNWLEVSLKGFQADAVLTATLPDGRRLTQELHDGSSYLSSEDPRAHFGLGKNTSVAKLTIRWPDGKLTHLSNLRANRIITVAPPGKG